MAIKQQDFYTLQEVAKLLRISERSMYRYIKDRKIRATKVGYWRIQHNDLDGFLRRRTSAKKQ